MGEKKKFLYVKRPANEQTPIQVLKNLKGNKKFLLESKIQHEKKGKYSFLGVNPYQEVIGREGQTIITDLEKQQTEIEEENALHYLKNHMPYIDIDLPLPFYGGAVGYIGYDAIRPFEAIGPALSDPLHMPDLHLMFYQDLIVFNHIKNEIYLIAINLDEQTENELNQRIEKLEALCRNNESLQIQPFDGIDFKPDTTETAFIEKVKIAKEHIQKGEVLQVVVSQRMTAAIDPDPDFPFTFYQKLREENPSPYMFYIDFEDYLILGASPESLVQTTGEEVVTNPIAGTRPRGSTPEQDDFLKKELLQDQKEIAEHQMLVDLSKSDLGKVCEANSITVPTYMEVEKYQHVMHIISEVKGRLRDGFSSMDALLACLPAGTVSGSPKRKAMQIINQLEEKKRGAYGGGIGYINFNHDLNIALTIRSLIIKDQLAYIQAGAGVVRDSIPENEYQETLNKAKSLLEVQHHNPTILTGEEKVYHETVSSKSN